MRHECFFLPALEDVIPTVINDLQRHIISSRASTPKALVNEVLSFHQDIHRTHHCFPEVHNLLK